MYGWRNRNRALAALTLAAALCAPAAAHADPSELSTTDRLDTRRYVAAGDRAYVMGFQDGSFQAQGWHITGEMGGVWSQPLKLIDGLWFSVDGQAVGPATKFTSGRGYVRMDLPEKDGVKLTRTDFAPDGKRAALFGLGLTNGGAARTVSIAVDVRSEVMGQYPWQSTTPSAADVNAQDTGEFSGGTLTFRDATLDRTALVGSSQTPTGGETGDGHWGSQAPPETCGGDDMFSCDDGTAGRGTGGQLRYEIDLPAGASRTLWIAVAATREDLDGALANPGAALAAKRADRERWSRFTQLSLPGSPRLAEAIDWGKQNILDLTQRADDLQVRDVDEGRAYPPPVGTVPHVRWVGAGYPDYPWLFATDGEYTAFASVAVGQFEAIQDHARALRDVSVLLNGDSGKVAHEVVGDGSVYYGSLADSGNTDETAKFPSMVALIWRWTGDNAFRDDLYDFARRNMHFVYEQLDADGDGWPEGLGNVERTGMGEEKLDNAVYALRGLTDLADMAAAKGDRATRDWATRRAATLRRQFEAAWWMPSLRQYADSLDDPGNVQVQQKHWIGQTPMEAELTSPDGRAVPGIATSANGSAALAERESGCFSGERPYNLGLFHTGCGGGPEGKGERTIFSLNTAIQAVGEGNYGRLGDGQQRRYIDANVEPMFGEPWTNGTPDEQPGAMPEILPSPDVDPTGDRDASIDRCTRCRAMVMQAWGNYGTAWPVVHQQLGVRPDLGRRALEIVPQLPAGGAPIEGRNVRLGDGAQALVRVETRGKRYRTFVDTGSAPIHRLRIGHTLPRTARVKTVILDGRKARPELRLTNRGLEVTVTARPGRHVLDVLIER